MSRSHSCPLEFSSLRNRSAKLVQGTNSNFMAVPVLAVKSLDSSTRALAGSQAAQHSVSGLPFAWGGDASASISAVVSPAHPATTVFMIDPLAIGLLYDPN